MDLESDVDNIYEVEKILDAKRKVSWKLFLVLWVQYEGNSGVPVMIRIFVRWTGLIEWFSHSV